MAGGGKANKWRPDWLHAALLCAILAVLWSMNTSRTRTHGLLEAPVGSLWEGAQNTSLSIQLPAWAGIGAPKHGKFTNITDGNISAEGGWYAQFGEDQWLWNHLFYNKVNGFYLEFGAMNGMEISNTRWMHEHAGWKGMLIEACPNQYAELAKNRPQDICVHAAICSDFEQMHWISKGGVGGIWEFMTENFKHTFHPGVSVNQLPTVSCVPLMYLLDRFGINHIDLWSLDVEGAELSVLQTFDFSRVHVDVLVVETDLTFGNKTRDAMVHNLLVSEGFLTVNQGGDNTPRTMSTMETVFVHPDFVPRISSHPGITITKA